MHKKQKIHEKNISFLFSSFWKVSVQFEKLNKTWKKYKKIKPKKSNKVFHKTINEKYNQCRDNSVHTEVFYSSEKDTTSWCTVPPALSTQILATVASNWSHDIIVRNPQIPRLFAWNHLKLLRHKKGGLPLQAFTDRFLVKVLHGPMALPAPN